MTQSKKTEISSSVETSPQNESNKSTRSFLPLITLLLLLLLTAAAAAVTYYFWQQQQNSLSSQNSTNAQLKQKLQALDVKNNKLMSQLTKHNNQLEQLGTLQSKTSLIAQQALKTSTRNQRDWLLAEIDYLLRIAHRRLQISGDINSAMAALTAADKRLYDLSDLDLFPVRKQLQIDIAKLKSVSQVDVSGAAIAIDQMLSHLSTLPFKNIDDEIKTQLSPHQISTQTVVKTGFIDSVIDTVMNIGDIKIHSRSLKPINNPNQQLQIEQALRGHLLTARLSVLRHDQIQFEHDLKSAIGLLQKHYQSSDSRIMQLQKDLTSFSHYQLSPALPDINKPWTLLKNILAKQSQALTIIDKKISVKKQSEKTRDITINKQGAVK